MSARVTLIKRVLCICSQLLAQNMLQWKKAAALNERPLQETPALGKVYAAVLRAALEMMLVNHRPRTGKWLLRDHPASSDRPHPPAVGSESMEAGSHSKHLNTGWTYSFREARGAMEEP